LGDGVVVVAVEPAHHVGGDELAGVGVGADDVELVLLVAAPGVGDEALPTEEEAGVAVFFLDGNLRPVGVALGPVGGGPAGVEVVEGLVMVAAPFVELLLDVGAVGLAGVLVVDLPADDVGIVAVAFGHALGYIAGELAVFGVGPVELL